jgi:uncharacterized membrane protein YedE/YeeE
MALTVDWAAFTPWHAALGGILIGVAAAWFVLVHGRIAGISGIVGGLLSRPGGDAGWRIAFILGLLAAPAVYALVASVPRIVFDTDHPVLIVAGLLVGIGTRYAAGCTSGHGVCGISRLAPRSIVATIVFMAAGFATVFAVRHVLA